MVLVINDEDVKSLLTMEMCVDSIEDAYRELGLARAANAPRRETFVPTLDPEAFYVFKTMEGAIPKLGVVAQRINSDRLTWPTVSGVRRRVKVPAASGGRYVGLVFLYSIESLELLAIMNDGELQRMRVAATSGVAANYLARKDSTTLGLFGSGWQAETQLAAMRTVRDIQSVKVYSPDPAHRVKFCDEVGFRSGVDVKPVDEPHEAASGADIVNAATNSEAPVCKGEWLQDGVHLSCIRPNEFDAGAWNRADLVVYTALPSVIMRYGIGDMARLPVFEGGGSEGRDAHAHEGFFEPYQSKMFPLTELLLKRAPARSVDRQITLMYKGIGLGIEFAATAKKVYDLAREGGRGREISSDWFAQTSHP